MTTRGRGPERGVRAVLAVGGLVVVGLLVVAAAVVLLRGPSTPSRVAAPAVTASGSPEELARAACVQLRLAAQGIQASSAAADVRTQLAAARALAAAAVRADGRWAALSGGVAALDEAVRRDEGPAAAAGLRVALLECDALG